MAAQIRKAPVVISIARKAEKDLLFSLSAET